MRIVTSVMKKNFVGKSEKDAFLKMAKYLFTYFFKEGLARNRADSITFYMVRDAKLPTICLEINAELPIKDIIDDHCKACREFNNLPYIENSRHAKKCENCPIDGLMKRINNRMRIRGSFLGERIRYIKSERTKRKKERKERKEMQKE